jgi:lipopolysaccharide/colanic/teichoic acid biosynthesis glycosyltransferase
MKIMYGNSVKKLFDFLVAFIGLFLILPLLIALIFILTVVNNGKPIYFQARTGKNGKLFTIIKLKTMNDKVDSEGNLLPH